MEPLLEALYNYALKYRFDGYFLPDEDERRENETMVRLAREELSAKGVTFTITIDYYIKAGVETAVDTATIMK